MTTHEHRQPTHREDLERTLVGGIACFIGEDPAKAKAIADGIKTLLDGLDPAMTQPAPIMADGSAADPEKFGVLAIDVREDFDFNSNSLEREIQAKANKAPRVTPADIEAEIASVHYFTASDAIQHENAVHDHKGGWLLGSTQLLTFCVIQMRNGFTVTGESACASPENFDAEIGRKVARANAVQKIWPLMGYALKDKLAG